jgi:hypothetical protein
MFLKRDYYLVKAGNEDKENPQQPSRHLVPRHILPLFVSWLGVLLMLAPVWSLGAR